MEKRKNKNLSQDKFNHQLYNKYSPKQNVRPAISNFDINYFKNKTRKLEDQLENQKMKFTLPLIK